MNLEDQLRNHLETKSATLDVPMVDLHVTPHPERSTPRRLTAVTAIALAAVALFGFSQFSDTLRDPQTAPIAAPLPELAAITQTVPTDLALPIELQWTKVLDQGGLQLIAIGDTIHGIPNGFTDGADTIWSTFDGITWTPTPSADSLNYVVASERRAVGIEWDVDSNVTTLKTSTDGTHWNEVATPLPAGHTIRFGGFDGERFVVASYFDQHFQNFKELLPEPYRSDPNLDVYRDGSAVYVHLSLGVAGLPIARFGADELGLEPLDNHQPAEPELMWTTDFKTWEPLDKPESLGPWPQLANSSEIVFFDWNTQNRVVQLVDGEYETIDLDFRLDQLTGRAGNWIARSFDGSSAKIHLSEDLRTWTSLESPPTPHVDLLGSGPMGVIAIGLDRSQIDVQPEPVVLYSNDGTEVVLDPSAGKIDVTHEGEWLYEVQLYTNSPSGHVSYDDGILMFDDRNGEPLAEIDPSSIEASTLPNWPAVPATVHFSTGDSAWSTYELPPVSMGPWRDQILVTDEFSLISFGDGVWMGTINE